MKLTRERLDKILNKYGNDVKTIFEVIDALGKVSLSRVDWESFKAYISREVYFHNLNMVNEANTGGDFWVLYFDEYKTVVTCYLDIVVITGQVSRTVKVKLSVQ